MHGFDDTSFSRRAFLGGAAALATRGFFELLPRVEGGYLAPVANTFGPKVALAAEGDATFTIRVVGADEVGFHVVDVASTDAAGNYLPVENATVTLKSRFNDETASGDTDDNGEVTLNIAKLAMRDEDGKLINDRYQCNAEIAIDTKNSRSKMRDFSIGVAHIEGASGFNIGAHKLLKDDDLYVERLGFDAWDLLYTKNTFVRSTKNDYSHTIQARFKGVKDKITVTLEAAWTGKDKNGKDKDKTYKKTVTKSVDSETGLATVEFSGDFLEVGDSDCFDADDVPMKLTYTTDNKTIHELKFHLYTEQAPMEGLIYTEPLTPFLTSNGVLGSLSIGNADWPCFNNCDISLINFSFPVHATFSPYDVMVSFGDDFTAVDEKGTKSPNEWKKEATKPIRDRFDEAMGRYEKGIKQLRSANPFVDENGKEYLKPFAKKFKVKAIYQLVLGGQFDKFKGQGSKVTKTFAFKLGVGLGINVQGSFTWNFMIPVVMAPGFFSITPGIEAVGAFSWTHTRELLKDENVSVDDIMKAEWVPDTSFALNIKGKFKLALGVGIDGVVAASVAGGITFPMYFGWGEKGRPSWAPDTHFTVGITFKAEILLQLVCVSVSINVWSTSKNPFYNNWEKNPYKLAEAVEDAWASDDTNPRFLLTQPNGERRHSITLASDGTVSAMVGSNGALLGADGDVMECLRLVTMDDMAASYEARAVTIAEPANDDFDAPQVLRDTIPQLVRNDDGTFTTQLVECKGVNTFSWVNEALTAQGSEEAADEEGSAADEAEAATTADGVVVEGVVPVADATDKAGADTGTDEGTTPSEADAQEEFLTAQEDAEPDFLGDPYLGFCAPASGEYNYEAVEGKTTGNVCDVGSIDAIAEHDGIKPTVDVVIYNGVFSDPRQRIVKIGDTPYLFRIMTVDYSMGGTAVRRPRVVASAFDFDSRTWGEPKVIEYNSGNNNLRRLEMFDYDFDIVTRSAGTGWTKGVEACLVITGGLRPQGDSTTVYDIFATPTVSIVLIDRDLRVFQRSVKQASELYDNGRAHMAGVPHVCDGFAVGGETGVLAFAFLHRSADDPKQLMTNAAQVSFGFGHCYVRDGVLSVSINTSDALKLDSSVTSLEMAAGAGVEGSYDALATLLFHKTQGYEVVSATIPAGKSFADLELRHCISSTAQLQHIAAWPGHGTFLFTQYRGEEKQSEASDYYLYAGTYDPLLEGQAGFESNYARMDAHGLKGATFCVSPTGQYLFYYETFEGNPGDDIDPKTGEHTPTYDHIYRIMASKYDNGAFGGDFPFCEVDEPIDGFEVMNITQDASTFLATQITDADHSLAQLRYIAVPHALVAAVEGFRPLDAFVCAGRPCSFQVDVRNHGNVIIGGFDVSLCDPATGNTVVSTYTVQTIDPKNILDTAHTRFDWMDDVVTPDEGLSAAADGWATDEGATSDENMVMPGSLLSYRVSFDIPSNWEGDKEVLVRLSNLWTPGIQYEPDGMRKHEDDGVGGTLQVLTAEAATTLIDPEERIYQRGQNDPDNPDDPVAPDDNGGNDDSGGDNGGRKDGRTSSPLPQTGDPAAGMLAPLGLALGGFGSLLGAYSARRTEIERDRRAAEACDEEEEA